MTNIAGVFTALALALLTAPFASCAKKEAKIDFGNGVSIGIVEIPDNNFCITKTEITQDVYQAVTGENPSKEQGDKFPVESVSWYDAIVFCNKLSAIQQKTPCYSVNGSANPDEWGYAPHQNQKIAGKIDFDPSADGYRIPTLDEWDVAIRGGEKYKYSGSDEFTANDYAVSPCLEYVPYTTYLISFDYKANSPYYTEKLTAYYGPSVNLYYDYGLFVPLLYKNPGDYGRFDLVVNLSGYLCYCLIA